MTTLVEAYSKIRGVDKLSAAELHGHRVLLREDLNAPLATRGGVVVVDNDARLVAALPTIELLCRAGARIVLISHLGRPKGIDPLLSLHPVALRLADLLALSGIKLTFLPSCIGSNALDAAVHLAPGEVLLLENTRFHPGEESNAPEFSAQLAALVDGDIYCGDAFACAHRANASTCGVAKLCRTRVAGLLMRRELEFLGPAIQFPRAPFAVLLGGAKVSSKLALIHAMLHKCDRILLGGAMAFTFLRAAGLSVGASLVEEELIGAARDLLQLAETNQVEIVLPRDLVVAEGPHSLQHMQVVAVSDVPDALMALDIGPATVNAFCSELEGCQTVLWNGPMGVCEVDAFCRGTDAMIDFIAALTSRGCCTIVGGGETVAAVEKKVPVTPTLTLTLTL